MLLPRPDLEETLAGTGVDLHVEHFRPTQSPDEALVAVHGFAAHCGLYRHVGCGLSQLGIAVTAFDCRGHGRSGGRRGYVSRFALYLDDLRLVLARARARTPGVPLTLLGHSHGATIALAYLLASEPAQSGPRPDRLILLAPYLALRLPLPRWKRLISPLVSRLWPTLSMDNELRGTDVSRNPAVHANFDTDPLVLHVATARWFEEVRRTQAFIRGAAQRVALPTLLVVAGQDRIVDTEVALAFAAAAGSMVEVRRYEALYHEVLLEPERDVVVADIAAWIRTPRSRHPDLPRAPSDDPGILPTAS